MSSRRDRRLVRDSAERHSLGSETMRPHEPFRVELPHSAVCPRGKEATLQYSYDAAERFRRSEYSSGVGAPTLRARTSWRRVLSLSLVQSPAKWSFVEHLQLWSRRLNRFWRLTKSPLNVRWGEVRPVEGHTALIYSSLLILREVFLRKTSVASTSSTLLTSTVICVYHKAKQKVKTVCSGVQNSLSERIRSQKWIYSRSFLLVNFLVNRFDKKNS